MDTSDIDNLRTKGLTWLRKNHPTLTIEEREDVLQDALIELVRKADVADHGALLGTIIDRRAANLIRAKKSRAKVELAAGDTTDLSILSENVHMTIDGAIFASDFDRALRGLPDDQRDAFILNELRGLTNYETAIHLGISPSTVAHRVALGKDALRKELA